MAEITTDTPRVPRTCQGVILSFPLVYNEGDVLAANEAQVLSQTFIENLRNNFASKVVEFYKNVGAWDEEAEKKTRDLDPSEVAQLQELFDKYVEAYEFGVRTGGRTPLDPIMAQALALAEPKVKEKLKSMGHSLASIGKEKIRELAEQAIEKNPKFLEKAREIVAARQLATEDLSVDI